MVHANTVRRVVQIAAFAPGTQVLEVGPGLGTLSVALIDAGARLIAIEYDQKLEPALREVLGAREATLVWGDALKVDVRKYVGDRDTAMVANLPYQIATPLVMDLLEEVPRIRSYTVMVQREVGDRLVARPGQDAYGAVSAKIAYFAEASIAFRVSRRVFSPMPDVESVVVRLARRARPAAAGGRERIFAVIEAGFAQRRKTIRRALRGGGWDASDVEAALEGAKVAGEDRAETLGLAEFSALARRLPPKSGLRPGGRARKVTR